MATQQSANSLEGFYESLKDNEEKAVFLACKDVIQESKQPLSWPSLFGVLFQSVSRLSEAVGKNFTEFEDKSAKTDFDELVSRLRASARLFELSCENLSAALLKKAFPDLVSLLAAVISKNPPVAVMKPVLGVARVVLTSTAAEVSLANSYAKLLKLVLQVAVESKPKSRKKAVDVFGQILNADGAPERISPTLLKYTLGVLRDCRQDNIHPTLYLLELLKHSIGLLPSAAKKKICEAVLRLPSLGHSMVTVCSINLFGAVLDKVEATELDSLLVPLTNALFDIQPQEIEVDPSVAFFSALGTSYRSLAGIDSAMCAKKLPQLATQVVAAFKSDSAKVHKAAAAALEGVFGSAVTVDLVKEMVVAFSKSDSSASVVLPETIAALKEGLTFTYQRGWLPLLSLLSNLCLHLRTLLSTPVDPTTREAMFALLRPTITDAVQLHHQESGAQTGRWSDAVETFLGSALQLIGLENLLKLFPLQFPTIDYETSKKPNSDHLWLLPFLKNHLDAADLAFFANTFVPVIEKLQKNRAASKKENRLYEAKVLDNLSSQIWELWPAFCKRAVDIAVGFPLLAKFMYSTLIEKAKLRSAVAAGIIAVVARAKEQTPQFDSKSAVAAVTQFAKNYVPGTFNTLISAQMTGAERTALLNAAEAFVSIAEPALVEQSFKSAATRLVKATSPAADENDEAKLARITQMQQLCDIMAVLIPFLSMKEVELLYRTIRPLLLHDDGIIQKKSLKLFYLICRHHRALVKSNMKECLKILEETQPKNKNAAVKKIRVRLMQVLLEESPALDIQVLQQLMPEIILYTKEVNAKTRDSAEETLIYLGDRCVSSGGDNLKTLFDVIAAGLALDPHFVSSTIRTLTYLVNRYSAHLSQNICRDLLSTITMFLQERSREIVSSALDFVRIGIKNFAPEIVSENLKPMIQGLVMWSEESKNRFRAKVKVILEKLIRKLGYDVVAPLVPFSKLMTNIRKSLARKEREKKDKKKGKKGDKDSDDMDEEGGEKDIDSDEEEELFNSKKNEQEGIWVMEKTDDQIIDFLSPTASKHVSSVNPEQKKSGKRSRESAFEINEEGKMVINDLPEQDNISKKKQKKDAERLVPDAMLGKEFVNRAAAIIQKRREKREALLAQHKKIVQGGDRFKADKAGGDVKKGKLDPYAYVPLDPAQLNKRSRGTAHKRYEPIVSKVSKTTPTGGGIRKPQGRMRSKLSRHSKSSKKE